MEGKSSDSKEIDSLRLELERVKEDLNSKNHEIECMEKGIEATYEITSREIDALRKARLNSMEENRSLRDQISKKDNEIADLFNPPPPSMNDSSQKLPGWISDDLRPLVYERGLEDKVMKLDKEYAKEDILEALQELLPEMGWFREARQISYPINPFIVDQQILKTFFQEKGLQSNWVAQKQYHCPKKCLLHQ